MRVSKTGLFQRLTLSKDRPGAGEVTSIVTLRSTDHFGDHHHHDQGSFVIYRNGLLAVDPPVYRKVRGPQQPTEVHNTLNTHRVSMSYRAKATLKLVHLIEVGDGSAPGLAGDAAVRELERSIEMTLDGAMFLFSTQPPFAVEAPKANALNRN